MLFFEGAVLSLIIGWIRRGKLSHFKYVSIKRIEFFIVPLILRAFLLWGTLKNINPIIRYGHYLFFLSFLLFLFALWFNRHLFEFKLAGLGILSNLICITSNGGRMPVREVGLKAFPSSWATSIRAGTDPQHILLSPKTNLKFLADIFVLPSGSYSIGDIILTLAIFLLIQRIMCSSKPISGG